MSFQHMYGMLTAHLIIRDVQVGQLFHGAQSLGYRHKRYICKLVVGNAQRLEKVTTNDQTQLR